VRLIRSWPLRQPTGRNCVIDDAERLYNDNYDYSGLVEVDDDVIHLDWDTAVTREALVRFADLCRAEPESVRVAPQRIYSDSRRGLAETIWNMKRYEGNGMRYLHTGEPSCHLFGFGMVYLPQALIRGFVDWFAQELADGSMTLNDIAFSGWHHRNIKQETPVAWDCETVHLHYQISDVIK